MTRIHSSNSTALYRFLTAVVLSIAVTVPATAIEWKHFESSVRGFPVMRDLNGRRVADGDFVQWNARDGLHMELTYAFTDGRRVEETAVLRQRPELIQDKWTWRELRRGKPIRAFNLNLRSGVATAMKVEDGEVKQWSKTFADLPAGRTFAGFGFALAAKALRESLIQGQTVELKTVGFTPEPKDVSVELSYGGRDTVGMAGRRIPAHRYVVHPKIPAIAKLFVKVPDAQIWLTLPPAGFLRMEGALAEPDDQMVRVDLLPGGTSGAATPVATSGKSKRR